MKTITLTFNISEDLAIKGVQFDFNDTCLPDDSITLYRLALALAVSVKSNEESLGVQDLLNSLDINRTDEN